MGRGSRWMSGNAILRTDLPPLMPIRVSMYDGRPCITDDMLKTGVYSGMTSSRTGMMYAPA